MKSEKRVRKVPRFVDIAITATVIILGVVLVLLLPSNLYLGLSLVAIGIMVFFCCRTGFKIDGRDGVFVRKQYVLPSETCNEIITFLEGDDGQLVLQPFRMGGMLMNVYTNKSIMLCQLLINDAECFVPQSELIEINQAKLDEVLKYSTI